MATLEYFNQIETAMDQAIQALEAAGQDTAELREAQDRIRNLADICDLDRIKRVKAGIDQAWEALDRTSQWGGPIRLDSDGALRGKRL